MNILPQKTQVALRKESVDRNLEYAHAIDADGVVALRKESVDRNVALTKCKGTDGCRSPQGERG